jgi:tRNA threonylcarbamoyladenosine biosynthesis protein TsaE
MIVRDEADMSALGTKLASDIMPGQLVTLSGPLGAGKTVLAKAIVKALGFAGDVSSPTYAIIHEYVGPEMRVPVVHADLYRLNAPDELTELGLFDRDDCLMLVEWPERGGIALSRPDIAVHILPQPDGSRSVEIENKRNAV